MIECAVLAIGEELLEGSVIDTNSAFISRTLMDIGISPRIVRLVPDDLDEIAAVISDCMGKYPVVITTGGLGPTFDDLTIEAAAAACGVKTSLVEEVKDHVEKRLGGFGLLLTELQLKQAMLPEGAIPLPNPNGTAWGFAKEKGSSVVISMPGVPLEMRPMMKNHVIPYLQNRFNPHTPYKIDLRFCNLPEPTLDEAVRDTGIPQDVTCIINASMGEVILKVRSGDKSSGAAFAAKIKERFEANFFGYNDESPAVALVNRMKSLNFTVSVAESCTGGLLGAEITAVPGSSDVFYGGVISYANAVKTNMLNVPVDILNTAGAVSEECAIAMAEGVKALLKSDCAISITGIAGPGGGSEDKPVGTVYICVIHGDKKLVKRFTFGGERQDIRLRAVKTAVVMMLTLINS